MWGLFPFQKRKKNPCALGFGCLLHPNTMDSFSCSSPLTFLFFRFAAFFPTTRWRRVSCSGNSACKTRCLLFEVLWLFRRLLGASGPTGEVFYHLSGLGKGSGSLNKKKLKGFLHHFPHLAWGLSFAFQIDFTKYRRQLTCPLITANCLWNCPLSKPGSFCETQ